MKQIEPTKQNDRLIAEVISIDMKEQLNKKKTGAQDLLNSIDTQIK